VSVRLAPPPADKAPEPFIASRTAPIRSQDTPSVDVILALHLDFYGLHLMMVRRPCELSPWTRSTEPWTYSMAFRSERKFINP
jgi:hypothetical protein